MLASESLCVCSYAFCFQVALLRDLWTVGGKGAEKEKGRVTTAGINGETERCVGEPPGAPHPTSLPRQVDLAAELLAAHQSRQGT